MIHYLAHKKIRLILLSVVLIFLTVFIACSLALKMAKKNVTSFDECVAITGIVQESYPARCIYDGKTFVQEVDDEELENITSPLDEIIGGDEPASFATE